MSPAGPIGLDAHFLARHEGNRAYIRNLLLGLARLSPGERPDLRAYVFEVAEARDALEPEARGLRLERLFPRARGLRVALAPPLLARRDGLALWHATFSAPPFLKIPYVLAIHDALYATRPDLLPRWLAARLRLTLPRALLRAARVVVPTEAVRRDLIEAAGVDPAKIDLAPFGIDTRRFSPAPTEPPARPYLLYVGRADARKGLDLLLPAAAHALRETRSGARLVLAGPIEGARREALLRSAKLEGVELEVLSDVPDESLPGLYREATALVYPSRGEGVGVPILEGLACGTPVIATALPAAREVAGDAAFALVEPGDRDALALAITRALEGGSEVEAARTRGPEQASRWSAEAMARATLRSWERALSG